MLFHFIPDALSVSVTEYYFYLFLTEMIFVQLCRKVSISNIHLVSSSQLFGQSVRHCISTIHSYVICLISFSHHRYTYSGLRSWYFFFSVTDLFAVTLSCNHWMPISRMFSTWKITLCSVWFQFEACTWLCVNRGVAVHNYQIDILALIAKCCLKHTVNLWCECYRRCKHLFICNFALPLTQTPTNSEYIAGAVCNMHST